ncbi:hypothetical protein [Flavobacterium sp.]|uniref:hypothetical protein n=1 Tax=Flavobacterium sp. TaxID=239 RepID=UPI0024874CBA|nr:hypothetical protein [Flavobacterium sp.]MDI1316536.1 hypothetical protein [Flavobacterium sp.]
MKSKLIFCSLFALSIAFTSCKKEDETETATASETPQPLIVPRVQPIPTENYAQPNQQQVNMPTQNMPQAVAQAPVVTKAGMNPAHGQPGHRCDIAVGAPLNSPATKPAATTINPAKASFTTSTVSNPTATGSSGVPDLLKPNAAPAPTAPGMNPPHGQEGHQCGVAVGAPLPKTDSQ